MPVSQHIGQFTDLLSVSDWLVERGGKVVGTENRKVGIFRFAILIRVAVDHCKIIVVILLADKTAGILTEGADLVFKRARISDQLGFVQNLIDELHHLIAHLNSNADVYCARLVCDSMFCTDPFQPVGTPSAGRDYRMSGQTVTAFLTSAQCRADTAFPFQQQFFTFPAKQHLDPFFGKILFNCKVELLGLFGTEMTNRTIDQLQPCLNRVFTDHLNLIRVADPFHMAVCPKLQIDIVGIMNRLLHQVGTHQLRQISPNLIGQGEFSIRKGTRTGKTSGNMTVGLAVDAMPGNRFRTTPLFDWLSLFHNQNLLAAAAAHHFQCREDTRRTGTNNQHICLHNILPFRKKAAPAGS